MLHPLVLVWFIGLHGFVASSAAVGSSTASQPVASPRSTRTLGSFFGYGGGSQQQPQVQQQVLREEVKPLVYQVRYYDGKQQYQQQAVDKVGVDQQQQGKQVVTPVVVPVPTQQYQQVQYPAQYYYPQQYIQQQPGQVPYGQVVYVQVPPVGQQQSYYYQPTNGPVVVGQQQGLAGPVVVGGQQLVPCPVDYVYYNYVDGGGKQQRPQQGVVGVGVVTGVQQGQQQVQPGVVQPERSQQSASPVTYTNRVRPPGIGVQQYQQVQQVPVPVPVTAGVPVSQSSVPNAYDYNYYYNNQVQVPYYSYPQHYYNPVVSPSSDFFYVYTKQQQQQQRVDDKSSQATVSEQPTTPTKTE